MTDTGAVNNHNWYQMADSPSVRLKGGILPDSRDERFSPHPPITDRLQKRRVFVRIFNKGGSAKKILDSSRLIL